VLADAVGIVWLIGQIVFGSIFRPGDRWALTASPLIGGVQKLWDPQVFAGHATMTKEEELVYEIVRIVYMFQTCTKNSTRHSEMISA
jgi:hypothetical protein